VRSVMKPFNEWSADEQRRYCYFIEQMKLDGYIVKKRNRPAPKPMNYTETEDFYFEEFWLSGIKKAGDKQKTKRIYVTILRKNGMPEFHYFVLEDIKKRIKNKVFGFSALHPQTYLNGERWNDEIEIKEEVLLKLPFENDDVLDFAKLHDLPKCRAGETYPLWRKRLNKHIEDNKIMKGE